MAPKVRPEGGRGTTEITGSRNNLTRFCGGADCVLWERRFTEQLRVTAACWVTVFGAVIGLWFRG